MRVLTSTATLTIFSLISTFSCHPGWHFMRLLDLRGGETKATLLARFHKKKA